MQGSKSALTRISFLVALAAAASLVFAAGASAAWPVAGFSESGAQVTQNTAFPNTTITDVTVDAPLPSSFAAHPPACDKLHFLRIRNVGGPTDPSDADRVLVAQPGILEGAAGFLNVGANLVSRARAERGKYVEFWAVDRRPNCLEDNNGLKLGKQTGNPEDAIDYYYRQKPYNGQRFAGFVSPTSGASWLTDMGIRQTLDDWNSIITRGIPDPAVRGTKVYCGGHSLGGSITGAYADADFDGDPSTLADAGFNQCAGFFGLDTTVSAGDAEGTSDPTVDSLLGALPDGVVTLMRLGLFERFVSIPGVIDPEIMNMLDVVGLAADLKPTGESTLIDRLPPNANLEFALRLYHSRDYLDFASQALQPSLGQFRATNQAALGVFTDDNAMPLSIVRASLGFFKGGPVADKDFPLPGDLAKIPGLESVTGILASPKLAIATNKGFFGLGAPLYGWNNYNQLGGVTVPKNSDGVPYTSAASEVTDIRDFARTVSATPFDVIEKYFPIRLALESGGGNAIVHPQGTSSRPIIDIIAGDGPIGSSGAPAGSPVISGYDHFDVLTAAGQQNDGQPEKVTTNLLNFIF